MKTKHRPCSLRRCSFTRFTPSSRAAFGAAAALLALGCASSSAATFNIANGDVAALRAAITTANSNNVNDVINLAANGLYTATTEDSAGSGNAFPAIASDTNHTLTINGNGAVIRRSTAGGTPFFRLFSVSSNARVIFNRLTITNGRFTTGSGAGILTAGSVTLNECIVQSNAVTGGNESASATGGGIASTGGALEIIDSRVSNNTASAVQSARGGGIFASGTLLVRRSLVNGNAVASAGGGVGGGIHAQRMTTIENSTVSGNSATGPGSGAGIYHQPTAASATLLLTNCTIANNATDGGGEAGGVYSSGAIGNGAVSLRNTIVATNSASNGQDIFAAGGPVDSQGHNLIGNADGSSGWNASDLIGSTAMPLNPQLAPLGDYGGPTDTHALLATSPAIDAGDDVAISLVIDQRGYPRRIGPHVDIGAFEFDYAQSGSLVVTTIDEHDDGVCGVADCTLLEAITFANSNADEQTIGFADGVTGVITTSSTPTGLPISTRINIQGPGSRVLTVSAAGAGRVFNVAAGPSSISGLRIANGSVTGSGGGVSNTATLTLSFCRLDNNAATTNGGAILSAGPLTLFGCTFDNNDANGSGGAIHVLAGSFFNGSVAARNCTFVGNQADRGGALSNTGSATSPASTLLRNCTVTGNHAVTQAGGLINLGTGAGTVIQLENTIVAANTTSGTSRDVAGPMTSGGNNLIGDNTGSTGLAHNVNSDKVGSSGSPLNPNVGPLQNNGGTVDTVALLFGSQAINMGNNALAPTTDQRGFGRNGVSDIGAFEFNGVPPPVEVISIVSRKTHTGAGALDIDLPLGNTPGVESRSGGVNNAHTLVFTFAHPLTQVGGASVISGSGVVGSSGVAPNPRQYVVNLSGVANAQTITVRLTNLSDNVGGQTSSLNVSMGVLLGDSNGDRFVNSGDATQVKNRSGQNTTASNCRSDFNVDGTINSGDATVVRSRSGQFIP